MCAIVADVADLSTSPRPVSCPPPGAPGDRQRKGSNVSLGSDGRGPAAAAANWAPKSPVHAIPAFGDMPPAHYPHGSIRYVSQITTQTPRIPETVGELQRPPPPPASLTEEDAGGPEAPPPGPADPGTASGRAACPNGAPEKVLVKGSSGRRKGPAMDERKRLAATPRDTRGLRVWGRASVTAMCGRGGGVGTRPRYLIVCLWRRLLASRQCSF